LRIAYFTDTYLPNTDGVVSSIKLVTEYLHKYGHEVYVFCPSGIEEGDYTIPISSKKYQKYPQYKVSFPSFEIIPRLKEINPDIIHVHTPVTIGLTGLYLGKILNIPTVITYHTRLDSYMWYIRSKKDDRFIDIFTEWLYNQCPVIAPSKSIRQLLKDKRVETPIDIIPNPVNLKLTNVKKEPNHTPLLLHVGRICREKQIDLILKAFRKILRKQKAYLLITSSGPDEERLKRYVKELKIDEKVTFTGYLTIDELHKVYLKSDILIAASNTETQGLVVLEGMSSGCAVIARNAPGFMDIVKDGVNGLLFDTEKELVEKVIYLLRDDEKKIELINEGFNTVKKFYPDRLVPVLERYYVHNLSQSREPPVERFLYTLSISFIFILYMFVRDLDLPVNSRLTNISVDFLKYLLIVAKFFRI
jgi:1,2-diacylglycerol 3-alpha-glucosyltransferase